MLLFSLPGGGSGIGRAVCQRLASEGASVVVADISEESANETMVGLQNDLRGQGHMAAVVDVSSKESVKKLVTRIQPPSVCVNAAGITQDHFLLNMEEDHFDRVIQVNLKGSFLITQAVAQALVACGAPKGSIITVGSIVGKFGDDVLLHTREMKHTVVLPPVIRGQLKVSADLEGAVVVGEDLSLVHVLVKLLSIFPPEHHGSVGVETCSVAGDPRGGSLLEERHCGEVWRTNRKTD
uniref:Hydroxysteroid (17-beta) dehydrogenase 8 n=1 Tax=Labrus bergylta TaxID=56723 RepID=A0A3Q3G0F3_9LABR